MIEVDEDEQWEPVGIMPEEVVDIYAAFYGVKIHQRIITANGAGDNEKRIYRCPNEGCLHVMSANRAAGSSKFHIKERGDHNCQNSGRDDNQRQQHEVNNSNIVAGIEPEAHEQSPTPIQEQRQPAKRGRKRKRKQPMKQQLEEEAVDGEENVQAKALGEINEADLPIQMDLLEVIQQNDEEELPLLGLAMPTPRERCEKLQQMATKLDLEFRGFVDEGKFYITFDKSNPNVPGFNRATMLEINIRQQGFGRDALVADLASINGVRGTGVKHFNWPIPHFAHFLWAVHGLCHETFVVPVLPIRNKRGRKPNVSLPSEVMELPPEVTEPEETTNNGQAQQHEFSLMEAHPELRLEELANELALQLLRNKKDGIAQIVLHCRQQWYQRDRLVITETKSTIKVVEKNFAITEGYERWPKISRAHFRYALIGVAINYFGQPE